MDERHANLSNCGGNDHGHRYAFGITLCLWSPLFNAADKEQRTGPCNYSYRCTCHPDRSWRFQPLCETGLELYVDRAGDCAHRHRSALCHRNRHVRPENYDFDQELAARSLGASRAMALWTITVPQVKFSIQTGAFLAFITSLDEVVISMLISGGDNATITRRMFNSLRDQLDPTIAAISTCLIIVSITVLIGVQLIGRRKNIDK